MTDEELKKARWIDRSITILAVVIGCFLTYQFSNAKDLKSTLDNKANKEYVREQIRHHEEREEEVYKRLESLIKLSLEKQEAVVNSIDKRLERLENS